jgi:hypothetical protein
MTARNDFMEEACWQFSNQQPECKARLNNVESIGRKDICRNISGGLPAEREWEGNLRHRRIDSERTWMAQWKLYCGLASGPSKIYEIYDYGLGQDLHLVMALEWATLVLGLSSSFCSFGASVDLSNLGIGYSAGDNQKKKKFRN